MGQLSWTGTPKPPTQKQFDFIKLLISQRDTTKIDGQIAVARQQAVEGTLTLAAASVLIDYLKEQPYKDVPPAPPQATPVAERGKSLSEGIYVFHGQTYKVVESQEGRLYAKVWVHDDSEWVYAPGIVQDLHPDNAISAEEAAKFGQITGACVFCSRKLTDERSISVGYGPVCAERNGLPWGEAA